MPQSTYLTTRQLAERTGYSQAHIGFLFRSGRIKGIQPAHDILIDSKSWDKFSKTLPTGHKRGRKTQSVQSRSQSNLTYGDNADVQEGPKVAQAT